MKTFSKNERTCRNIKSTQTRLGCKPYIATKFMILTTSVQYYINISSCKHLIQVQ